MREDRCSLEFSIREFAFPWNLVPEKYVFPWKLVSWNPLQESATWNLASREV